MKKMLFLALGIWLVVLQIGVAADFAVADDAAIVEIKKLYADTNAAIAQARQDPAAGEGFYCSELVINSLNGSWRAVGNYQKRMLFWYSDQPQFAAFENLPAASVLIKVEVSETAAVRTDYREFLFHRGQLVFFFSRRQAGDQPAEEERCYFSQGRLLRRLKGSGTDSASDAATPLKEAENLQRLFLQTFD